MKMLAAKAFSHLLQLNRDIKKIVYVTFLISALLTVAKAQEVVKVGAFNFYPAIFQDKDGVVKGFYVDALSELGKKENLKRLE
jgi:hypothetical protein